MKKSTLFALALLLGAAGGVQAQVTPVDAAATPAPAEQRAPQRTPTPKAATLAPMKPADLSALVPRDSAKRASPEEHRANYHFDRRGVNCTLYPARCG